MKRNFLKYILLLIEFVIFSQVLSGQSSMTITETFMGQICSSFPTDVRTVTYSTKKECEQVRQRIHNTQRDVGGLGPSRCVALTTCSPCSGSDPASPNQPNQNSNIPENINFNGPGQGQSIYSVNNPLQDNKNWIDEEELRMYLQNLSERIDGNFGNKEFDEEWMQLVENGVEFIPVSKKGRKYYGTAPTITANVTETSELKLDTEEDSPFSGSIAYKQTMDDRTQSDLRREREQLINKMNQLDRFCASPHLKQYCAEYQEMKKELEAKFDELSTELKKMKKDEYDAEVKKYEQEKAKYEQEFFKCRSDLCRKNMREAIKETKDKLAEIEDRLSAENRLVDNYLTNYREPKMSNADKKEEIADERLRRIFEQQKELSEKLAKGEITKTEFALKEVNLVKQAKEASEDKAAAIAERAVVNTYQNIKEPVADFMQKNKDLIVDTGEFFAKKGISVLGVLSGPKGVIVAEGIINPGISTAINQSFREQRTGEAAWNAIESGIKDGISGAIPIVSDVKDGVDGGKLFYRWCNVPNKE